MPTTTVSMGLNFRRALGLNPDQTSGEISADLDHLQGLGVQAIWLVLAMEWGFPTSTTIDATVGAKWDEVVNQAAARSLPVVLQAHGNPSWNITAGGHSGTLWHGPDNATERGNWVTMLHNAVNRWGATKVQWVEVWNEPNISAFWEQGPSADLYCRLLQATYADIKASWPAVKVVGHNMSRNDVGWLDTVYTATDTAFTAPTAAANNYYFDVLGVHPYSGPNANGTGYDPVDNTHGFFTGAFGSVYLDFLGYRQLRSAIVAKEGRNKGLGFGEFGYTVGGTPGTNFFEATEPQRQQWIPAAAVLARGDAYVEYLCPYYHDSFGVVGGGYNIHGTATETAYVGA